MSLQPINIRLDWLPHVTTGTDSFGGRYTEADGIRVYQTTSTPAELAESARRRAAALYALSDHFAALAKDE